MAKDNSNDAAAQAAADAATKEAAEKAAADAAAAAEKEAAESAEKDAAEKSAAEAAANAPKEQTTEEACAELGLTIEDDRHCPVEICESITGGINLVKGDPHRFEAAEAVRAVRAGIAKPRA